LSEVIRQLSIGEVAERAGMSTSRIRYYEGRGVLPEPERAAGKRRYTEDVFRRLAIIDASQRVGSRSRRSAPCSGHVISPRMNGCASLRC
jgi:predicted site-specific integrase-resolvase